MKPKNETVFNPPKSVVITCNDNMSSYMTTQQVRHLFCVFHTESKRHFGGFSTVHCNRPSTFIFNCIKRQKRSYDRPKARTYSEANIPWIINRTLAEYELSIHRNNSQNMIACGITLVMLSRSKHNIQCHSIQLITAAPNLTYFQW